MRYVLVFMLLVVFAGGAFAADLDVGRPVKSDLHIPSNPAYDGREGGETVADAYPIMALPFGDSGATCDNLDDYDEACPYTISTSADVVYSFTADFDGFVQVDLCLSVYDTKVYMYDSGMNLVDCNDDFYFGDPPECHVYSSMLEAAPVMNGETYYIVVDGYGGDCGTYDIQVDSYEPPPPCELACPDGAQLEGEPPLEDEYVDNWNGGCGSIPPAFQWIECADFCGVTGWYQYTGLDFRDTDWFDCLATGTEITWMADAESSTNFYHLNMPDCSDVSVLQTMTAGPCIPVEMTIVTTPGEIVHLWVGSANFTNPGDVPDDEYDYVMRIEGIEGVSASEQGTWSRVKNLYR